jgi:hypothetical protein
VNQQTVEPTLEELQQIQADVVEELRLRESRNRWASWSYFVKSGLKGSYQGIEEDERAKRRKKGKAQRLARKRSR